MPTTPAVPKADVQERLKTWRLDAARVKKLWDRIGSGGEDAGEVVEILDSIAEKEAELAEEEDALKRRQSSSKKLSGQERAQFASNIELLRDTLEGYEAELEELPDDVRGPVQRAYEEAGRLMEHLVKLHHDCEVHKLESSAKEIVTELHRVNRHTEQIRSQLVIDVQLTQASGSSQASGPAGREVSPPHPRRRIIRPEGRGAREAAYLARKKKPSRLAHVESAENALAKSHSRLGYRQKLRYFGVGY